MFSQKFHSFTKSWEHPELRIILQVYRDVERYWRKILSSRSQKGKVCWDVFVEIKRTYPLQYPKLSLPYKRIKQFAVL